jgi:hypothetical protein
LQDGYEGLSLSDLEKLCHVNSPAMKVDFDLAFKQLEDADLIKTGPMVPYDDTADSALVFLGLWSKRDYAYLTESGYRLARNSRQGIERF